MSTNKCFLTRHGVENEFSVQVYSRLNTDYIVNVWKKNNREREREEREFRVRCSCMKIELQKREKERWRDDYVLNHGTSMNHLKLKQLMQKAQKYRTDNRCFFDD